MTDGPAKKIGDLLIEQRLITPTMLSQALDIQQKENKPLGKILVDLGYLSQEDLRNALAKQFGSIYINPKTFTLRNVDLLNLIPESDARKFVCFPFDKSGDELTVVIEDPLETETLSHLNSITKLRIRPVHAKKEVILEIIEKYYKEKESVAAPSKPLPDNLKSNITSGEQAQTQNSEGVNQNNVMPSATSENSAESIVVNDDLKQLNKSDIKNDLSSEGKETRSTPVSSLDSVSTNETQKPAEMSRPWQTVKPSGIVDNINQLEQIKPENKLPVPYLSFENFVVGPSNQLAWAAAQNVVAQPGIGFNPLFLYGGVGLGKTHLSNAIGNAIIQKYPKANVCYISIDTFVRELSDSIEKGELKNFQNRYRMLDTLLIDDVQFLSGQEKTQEEFFYIFEQLYRSNGQMVITSDRLPRQIDKLEDRLRTRFEGGLMVDIQIPDFDTRVAIFRKKASQRGLEIPDEITRMIAVRLPSNVREIEGIANRILAQSKLMNEPVSIEMIENILNIMAPKNDIKKNGVDSVVTRPGVLPSEGFR